jgi:hypothetical protein
VLLDAIRAWRYQPFVVDGKPTPVCTRVMFVFRFT